MPSLKYSERAPPTDWLGAEISPTHFNKRAVCDEVFYSAWLHGLQTHTFVKHVNQTFILLNESWILNKLWLNLDCSANQDAPWGSKSVKTSGPESQSAVDWTLAPVLILKWIFRDAGSLISWFPRIDRWMWSRVITRRFVTESEFELNSIM